MNSSTKCRPNGNCEDNGLLKWLLVLITIMWRLIDMKLWCLRRWKYFIDPHIYGHLIVSQTLSHICYRSGNYSLYYQDDWLKWNNACCSYKLEKEVKACPKVSPSMTSWSSGVALNQFQSRFSLTLSPSPFHNPNILHMCMPLHG